MATATTRVHVVNFAVTEGGLATSAGNADLSVTGFQGGNAFYVLQVAAQAASNQAAFNQLVVDYPVPLISPLGGTVMLNIPSYPGTANVCGTIVGTRY